MIKKSELSSGEMKNLIKKIIFRFSLFPIVLALLVILPAGTLRYWELYLYIAILIIPMLVSILYFLKNDPKFLERRTKAREKEKTQRIIQIVFTPLFFSTFFVSGLDHRFGWSNISVYIVLFADFIILLGYLLIFYVFKQNSYASRVVEVESNQKVISNGLYGIVRHPMYVGVLLMFIPAPIALGSYWAMISMSVLPIPLIFRILNEEAVLKRDLAGYIEYCQKTKYRLIPFVW